MFSRLAAYGAVLGLLVVVAGCSHNTPTPTPAAQQEATQQAIQKVQDNPNIPADQKANIVAHLQNPAGPPNMQVPPKAQ